MGDACPYAHSIFEYWLHPSRWVLGRTRASRQVRLWHNPIRHHPWATHQLAPAPTPHLGFPAFGFPAPTAPGRRGAARTGAQGLTVSATCPPIACRYRTQLCKDGGACKRWLCFFAHRWAATLAAHSGAGGRDLPGSCGHPGPGRALLCAARQPALGACWLACWLACLRGLQPCRKARNLRRRPLPSRPLRPRCVLATRSLAELRLPDNKPCVPSEEAMATVAAALAANAGAPGEPGRHGRWRRLEAHARRGSHARRATAPAHMRTCAAAAQRRPLQTGASCRPAHRPPMPLPLCRAGR